MSEKNEREELDEDELYIAWINHASGKIVIGRWTTNINKYAERLGVTVDRDRTKFGTGAPLAKFPMFNPYWESVPEGERKVTFPVPEYVKKILDLTVDDIMEKRRYYEQLLADRDAELRKSNAKT